MTINEDDVNYIEDFVRNRLHPILESKSKESKHNSMFYGRFVENPKEFIFSSTEKMMIKMLVEHVKNIKKSFKHQPC